MVSLLPFIKGMGMGASLIIAIGAQNAFVLNQAIKRSNQLLVALTCFLVDTLLITVGLLGVGSFISNNPQHLLLSKWGGALFLTYYGISSFLNMRKRSELKASEGEFARTRVKAIVMTLAVSLLNPHVYLDTVVLLGSIGSQYNSDSRLYFGLGAILSSFIWFFSLAFGGTKLAPFFVNPRSWQYLDFFIGCIMIWMAITLII